jgi:acyltransferase
MRSADYDGYLLFWLNALCAIAVGWSLSIYIEKLLQYLEAKKVLNWLKSIGKNSIIYLCFNQMCIKFTEKFLSILSIPTMIEKLMCLALVLGELFILERMICGTKLKFIVGM